MIGLLLKDFYTLRQYGKTLLFLLVLFSFIGIGMDNPAIFFEGFITMISMMMVIYSFSYDNLAKWDRFGLSLPVTRREMVASKYLLSLILCVIGAVLSFLLSSLILYFKPVEDFGMMEHLMSLGAVITVIFIFFSILLPLIFKFGVEKSRLLLIAIFAAPTAFTISLGKLGMSLPSIETLISLIKLMPIIVIVVFFLSYLLSVKIFSAKEI